MKHLLISSYLSQAYVSLIGILLMPAYLHYMGIEAVGLIGFFLMLQAWLQLLDAGLSQTLSRDMSLYQAGSLEAGVVWQRLRGLEFLLGLVSLLAAVLLVLASGLIASDWLALSEIPADAAARSVAAMAVAAALRLVAGLYRASLIGLGRQIPVNRITVVFATLKFAGVLPILVYWSAAPTVFFTYQALVGGLELAVFARMIYRTLPGNPAPAAPRLGALKAMLPMAGGMAASAAMWSLVTQLDKLILSKLLPLTAYGYFTLAALVASGVLMLIPPLNQVLQPRMTMLLSQSRRGELRALYEQATQVVTAVFLALGGVLALFAEPFLRAWTGDEIASASAAPVLFWYGLANATIGLLLLPFLLQFAHGYLRLHVVGNLIMLAVLVPLMVIGAVRYGGPGAGAALLVVNLLFLILWVPRVHGKLMPDMVWRWPLVDIGRIAVPTLAFLALARQLMPSIDSRTLLVVFLGGVFAMALTAGLLAGDLSRELLSRSFWRRA